MVKNKKTAFIRVSLFFVLFSTLIHSIPASADDSVVTEVQLSVPISCSMSGTGMESHNAEVVNGRTQENIGLTTIKAYCNDTSGFAVYAIGFTDYTYGNTALTDDELGSSYDIATSSTVVDATSSWSMKLAATSGTYTPIIAGSSVDSEKETGDPDFSSYQAVPTNYTKVAYRTASTDIGTSATGSSVTTTYKVHISPTQAAGNYSGLVKYTLVHPHTSPELHECNSAGTTISTIYCMQDITSSNKSTILASMTEGQAYTLKDSRDKEIYYVAKLKDGNIWMLDNLRLDLSKAVPSYTSSDKINLTSSNTNASEQAISCLLTGSYNSSTCTLPYATTGLTAETPSGGSWSSSGDQPSISTGGSCHYDNGCTNIPDSTSWNKDTVVSNTLGSGSGKIGVLYNYCAASAGSYCYIGYGAQITDPNPNSILDVEDDVCPTGWRMPTSSANGEYQGLYNEYTSDSPDQLTAFRTALSVTYAGYNMGGYTGAGVSGAVWSSTWGSNYEMYSMVFAINNDYASMSAISSAPYSHRVSGQSVRCIVK